MNRDRTSPRAEADFCLLLGLLGIALLQLLFRPVDDPLAADANELAATLRDCRRGPYRFWYRRVIDWKQRAPNQHS